MMNELDIDIHMANEAVAMAIVRGSRSFYDFLSAAW